MVTDWRSADRCLIFVRGCLKMSKLSHKSSKMKNTQQINFQKLFKCLESAHYSPRTVELKSRYLPIVVVSNSRVLSQIVGGCLTKYQTIKIHGLKFPKHLKFCKTAQQSSRTRVPKFGEFQSDFARSAEKMIDLCRLKKTLLCEAFKNERVPVVGLDFPIP